MEYKEGNGKEEEDETKKSIRFMRCLKTVPIYVDSEPVYCFMFFLSGQDTNSRFFSQKIT